ncbi:class I SAM-dependent methyltransferase [Allochromatium palmeri]|uniref:class I SAM-dependent methyltransferase n=1 Tax=Allochromatium palmeri TaxID=231048 RepID=UPI001CA3C0C2|nr:class I SAM-dependent methyltransferase [Allochromatium palmeri]
MLERHTVVQALEVGSYEGQSACFLIDTLTHRGPLELHCLDSWQGGLEHIKTGKDMSAVERRCRRNLQLAVGAAKHRVQVIIHKQPSDLGLAGLLAAQGLGYFDFVYVDGSHQAPDVLCDAVLAFRLLRVGGLLVFDDYLWSEHAPADTDLLRCPKLALDAFTNIYRRKLQVLPVSGNQLYARKLSD